MNALRLLWACGPLALIGIALVPTRPVTAAAPQEGKLRELFKGRVHGALIRGDRVVPFAAEGPILPPDETDGNLRGFLERAMQPGERFVFSRDRGGLGRLRSGWSNTEGARARLELPSGTTIELAGDFASPPELRVSDEGGRVLEVQHDPHRPEDGRIAFHADGVRQKGYAHEFIRSVQVSTDGQVVAVHAKGGIYVHAPGGDYALPIAAGFGLSRNGRVIAAFRKGRVDFTLDGQSAGSLPTRELPRAVAFAPGVVAIAERRRVTLYGHDEQAVLFSHALELPGAEYRSVDVAPDGQRVAASFLHRGAPGEGAGRDSAGTVEIFDRAGAVVVHGEFTLDEVSVPRLQFFGSSPKVLITTKGEVIELSWD